MSTEKATPASTETTPKDRRRSSFFGTLGKKDKKPVDANKKTDNAVSDAEGTDNEKKTNKLQGLFRKASKSVKGSNGTSTEADAPPVPAKEGEAVKEAEAAKEPEATKEVPATENTTSGLHVPENDTAAAAPIAESTEAPVSEPTEPSAPTVTASA